VLSVFLQQPGGSLFAPASYDVCARPSAVNAVDVNEDGTIDSARHSAFGHEPTQYLSYSKI
jgi:hypothetical protein